MGNVSGTPKASEMSQNISLLTDEDICLKFITALVSVGLVKHFLWPYVDEFLEKRTLKKASREEDIEKGKEKEEVESKEVQKKASGKIYNNEEDF
jgi:F0F1-type ATP synthase membrane subunit b/b'